jgi:sugar lactone lactonase YvrE
MSVEAELILEAKATVGEGPVWDVARGVLWWVDIEPGTVHCLDPATDEDTSFAPGERVGAVVPRRAGGLVAALEHGFAFLYPDTGSVERIADPEAGREGFRFNDGKCDPMGRFWAGTVGPGFAHGTGTLYCLHPGGLIEAKVPGLACSNGLAWSADRRTMYFIDTPTQQVCAFDYFEESGEIKGRRVAVEIPKDMGAPDGMAIDAEDNLWVALWGGGRVVCCDPSTGRILDEIRVPAPFSSSCAFGGESFDRLYITSAGGHLRDGQDGFAPLAGSLFVAEPGVAGLPPDLFAG